MATRPTPTSWQEQPGLFGFPALLLGLLAVLATSGALPCLNDHGIAGTNPLPDTAEFEGAHPCGGTAHCTVAAGDGRPANPDALPAPPPVVAAGPAAETLIAIAAAPAPEAFAPARANGRHTYLKTLRLRI